MSRAFTERSFGVAWQVRVAIYSVFFSSAILAVWLGGSLPDKVPFILLTLVLLSYLCFEICQERARCRGRMLINPAVLTSVCVFAISFGVTNIIWMVDEEPPSLLLGAITYDWMNQALLYALLAAFGMWQGYRFTLGKRIAGLMWRLPLLNKVLRREFELRWQFVVVCAVLSLGARLLQVRLGIFGYSSEIEELYRLASYREYLDIAASLGKLGLMGCALAYFAGAHRSTLMRVILILLFSVELAFGFLSGFKSAVLMPIVILWFCYYSITGKTPKKLIILATIFLLVSYLVTEPFRAARYADPNFQTKSLQSIGSVMVNEVQNADTFNGGLENSTSSLFATLLKRLNLTVEAAAAIQFKEELGLAEDAPQFFRNLLLAPVHAFVPRILVPSKPFDNVGAWYAREVHGVTTQVHSAAISPVGYLYFAGGGVIVFLGFFIIGILERAIYGRFSLAGSGGLVVLLCLLSYFALMENSVDSALISIIRYLPITLVGQYLLFKR